jgi:hypothetical protein
VKLTEIAAEKLRAKKSLLIIRGILRERIVPALQQLRFISFRLERLNAHLPPLLCNRSLIFSVGE